MKKIIIALMVCTLSCTLTSGCGNDKEISEQISVFSDIPDIEENSQMNSEISKPESSQTASEISKPESSQTTSEINNQESSFNGYQRPSSYYEDYYQQHSTIQETLSQSDIVGSWMMTHFINSQGQDMKVDTSSLIYIFRSDGTARISNEGSHVFSEGTYTINGMTVTYTYGEITSRKDIFEYIAESKELKCINSSGYVDYFERLTEYDWDQYLSDLINGL